MNNHVNKWLLIILFLFTTQLYAETNHLYVSDLIEKQVLPYKGQINYGSSWRNGSQRYKYNDVYLNQPLAYQQAVNMPNHVLYFSNNKVPQVYEDPVKNQINHFGRHIYEPSMAAKRMTTPNDMDEQYKRAYSNVLYVSDLEPIRRTLKKKHQIMSYDFQNEIEHIKERNTISYMPGALYNVPTIISGNISGISTPEYLKPVDSYTRPNYNPGRLNNSYVSPYNSLRPFGIFSRQ